MGSSSNRAGEEANRQEQARQASIRSTQRRVNQVFDNPQREADIADFVSAFREFQTQDLDRQKGANDRNMRFALARGGQVGGSVQNDKQEEANTAYSRGLLDIDRNAMGAGAELRAADQQARAQLISLATQGLDATTGAQQAAAALRSNLEAGRSTSLAQGVGDVFSRMNTYYQDSREAAERRRADRNAGWLYQPMGYGGAK